MSGALDQTTISEAQVIAERLGCTSVPSTSTTLQLDFDVWCPLNDMRFNKVRELLESAGVRIIKQESWTSRRGLGTHMLLTLDAEFTKLERVTLQAAFGSDPVREALAVFAHRLTDDGQEVSYLFRPKEQSQ